MLGCSRDVCDEEHHECPRAPSALTGVAGKDQRACTSREHEPEADGFKDRLRGLAERGLLAVAPARYVAGNGDAQDRLRGDRRYREQWPRSLRHIDIELAHGG